MSVSLFLGPFPAQICPLALHILLGIAGADPLAEEPSTPMPAAPAALRLLYVPVCDYVCGWDRSGFWLGGWLGTVMLQATSTPAAGLGAGGWVGGGVLPPCVFGLQCFSAALLLSFRAPPSPSQGSFSFTRYHRVMPLGTVRRLRDGLTQRGCGSSVAFLPWRNTAHQPRAGILPNPLPCTARTQHPASPRVREPPTFPYA